MKVRKPPIRTCVACRESSDKRGFVRFVRTPEGHVEVDVSGKTAGRGAYVCAKADCFEVARSRRKLDSALRVGLQDDDYNRLRRDFDELIAEKSSTAEE
jgi:predicted RNA-binding protein YlxR (DUF448 family)